MSSVTFSTDDFLAPTSPMSTASISPIERSPLWPLRDPVQCTKKKNRVLIEEIEDCDHQELPSLTHVWVQAENVVYEVHRDFLGPKAILGLRYAPFYLNGITPTEMDGFLELADARAVSNPSSFTVRQCADAISVAELLEFDKLRAYAMDQLEKALQLLDPFSCIELAMEYRNRAWLLEGLSRLCLRDEPLSFSEASRVPTGFVIAIVAIQPPLETAMWNRAQSLVENDPVFESMPRDVEAMEKQHERKCTPCKQKHSSLEYRPAVYATYLVAGHRYELPPSYLRTASKL
ncbi:hypothetical protein FRC01_003507, partial [Tulasnella sp. 417]